MMTTKSSRLLQAARRISSSMTLKELCWHTQATNQKLQTGHAMEVREVHQRSANKSTNSARESSDKPDLSSDEDEISSGYESRNEESGYPKDTFDSSENDALSSSDVGSYESEDESSSIEAEPIRRITSNATNKTTNSLLSRPSMKQRRLSQGSSHYSVHSKHSLYSHRRLHGFNMAHYLNHKTRMHPILNTHHIRPYLHHHIHHAKSKTKSLGLRWRAWHMQLLCPT